MVTDVGEVPDRCRQVIVVTAPNYASTAGTVEYFERDTPGGAWHSVDDSIPAVLGENGIGTGHDDSFETPEGSFPLGVSFGHYDKSIFDRPLKIRYVKAGEYHWWDTGYEYWRYLEAAGFPKSDATFNTMIVSEDEPTPNRARYPKAPDREVESLGPIDRVNGGENAAYNLAVFVNHNPTNTPGLGCAVFLHCTDSDGPTLGCIAIDEDTLAEIMVWLDPARLPYLSVLVEGS